jgi:hypothetical protein
MKQHGAAPAPRGVRGWRREMDQKALEKVWEFLSDGVEPVAEYVAAAGCNYGLVKVWKKEEGYLVYWGNNGEEYAVFEKSVDLDDLAEWLEFEGLDEFEALEQRANVRGADAIQEAKDGDEGPFYILVTRHWYGPTETSSLVLGDGRKPLAFETYKEAKEWIESEEDCVYCLAHSESSRPSYKVVTVG